jgi:serine/threonine protein kinase/Tfp pilus assembly protein PilF
MTASRPNNEAIFHAARDIPDPDRRRAYVREACSGDEARVAHVEALLAAADTPDSLLDRPTESDSVETVDRPAGERPGSVIGPYKLLEQLGEGGFGVVFMAEQTEPVRRKVALKVLKPGMDTHQVVARFEAERQALAIMDHPNIAKVFDGGATPSGRPYFVMELVRGVPITEFCDHNHLTPRQRLELFIPVCQAVQHAHQKGIIHRDLKPSNVLVSRHDTTPVVQVIDFGVAKALGQELTDKTLFTGVAQMVGTPLYMSPEQAGKSDLDIDTRSDIYSLGVLLYELLTGTTPFTKERFQRAAYDEIRRIIREEEPPRPSTRLSESGDSLSSISSQRHTEPAKLTKLVRGELDWIVMKSLEKDRNRRYETANNLAMDIQRYLVDEAVLARPPDAAYRFRKFARRNRTVLLAGALVALALVVGALVSVGQAVRARRAEASAQSLLESEKLAHASADSARAEALAQRELARANLRKARQVVDDMYTQVAEKWLNNQPQMEPIRREFLNKALRFYEEFAEQDGGTEPAVRLETARAYGRVAEIHQNMGASAQAEAPFRKAIEQLRGLAKEVPASPEYRQELAGTLHLHGFHLSDIGRKSEAEKVHREAVDLEERLAADFPSDATYQRNLARGQFHLGMELRTNKLQEAERAIGTAIALQERLAARVPSLPEDRACLAESIRGRGTITQLVDRDAALKDYRRSIDLVERLAAEFPNVPSYRYQLAHFMFEASEFLLLPLPEAEQTLRKALDILRKLATDFPGNMYYRNYAVLSLVNLAARLKTSHRTQEAIEALREARAIGERQAADTPAVQWTQYNIATVDVQLGLLLKAAGRADEANDLMRRLIENNTNPSSLNYAAWSLAVTPDLKERDPVLAVAMARKAVGLAPKAADIQNTLGVACYRNGDWNGAIAALMRSEELEPNKRLDFNALFLAMVHWQLGHKDEARAWYDRAVAWMDKHRPKNEELLRFRAEAEELMKMNKEPEKKADRP